MTTPRFCPACGAAVAADERFCASCGARQPDAAAPPGGRPAVEPTVVLPPVQPAPGADGPAAPAPPAPEPLRIPADAAAAPPAPRRRMPLWAVILLSLAGLCAIGCVVTALALGYFGTRVSTTVLATVGPELTALAEPTAEGDDSGLIVPTLDLPTRPPESTVAAAPTAEGAGGAVGGAVGGAAGAGGSDSAAQARTAQAAQATAAAELEATAEVGQLFSGATQVFADEFVDNRNAWFTGVFQEIETDTIEDGVFKVSWAGKGSSYELYELRELTNFIAEVDCLVASGGADGSCGLVFGQREGVGFYKFELFEDYYRLFVVQGEGDPPLLAEGSPEGIIRPGEPNRLRVIKQGDRVRIYLNGAPLADVEDATFPTGKVGVSTNSYREGPGVEIHFDNFAIWELP